MDSLFAACNYKSRIDTVKNLFLQKKELTDQLIELSEINRYRRRYGKVISILPDSINFQISQITYSSLRVDSVSELPKTTKHKNFFGRIARFLTGEKDKTPVHLKTPGISQKIDSSIITRIRKDPALSEVKQQLKKINKQDQRFIQLLSQREQTLVDLGNQLTGTIRQILKQLEKQAISESESHLREMDKMRKTLLNRLIFLGISAFLIILGFVAWIGNDLQKSRRLKEQLVRSEKEIKSLMKAKERFLASISPEIRTPLTAIIGFSELLRVEDS
jgi:signal transduction histidine kinase